MRRFLRFFGVFLLCIAVVLLVLRGLMGISFVMGSKDFYPPAGYFLNAKDKAVKFAVLSDTGSQNWTLERLVLEIKDNEHPDFILHLGDLVVYRNIEHMYWMMSELDRKLGAIPMYLVPGNHDVRKNKGVIDKSKYQRVFGPTYYWFSYANTLFIGLDSSTEDIDEEQWIFFEQVMKKVRPHFQHVVLFTHVPPVVPKEFGNHMLKESAVAKMSEMLKKYPVDVIFSGHVHYYSEQDFQGIPVYTTPPSGQYFVGPVHKFGYLIASIDDTGVHVKNMYSNRKKAAEVFELFFVDLVLTDKIRWIAGGIVLAGLLFLLMGQRWRALFQHFKKNQN